MKKKSVKTDNNYELLRSSKVKNKYFKEAFIMAREKKNVHKVSDDRWKASNHPATSSGV